MKLKTDAAVWSSQDGFREQTSVNSSPVKGVCELCVEASASQWDFIFGLH